MQRHLTALALGATLAFAGCGDDTTSSSTASNSSATSASTTPAATTSSSSSSTATAGKANTAEVATAANAFLDTLSDEQKDTVLYDFADEAKKTGWSNFPTTFVKRNGLSFADLTSEQQAAALKMMEAALSEQGYTRLEGIRAADAFLAANQGSGGGNGGPGAGSFGDDLYYVAFFGEPSTSSQFMVQFGGHHLAYNLTYDGDAVSISPSLTAVEPLEFDSGGKTLAPLKDESTTALAAIQSLTDDEEQAAEISGSFDDLLLGPGNDGPFPDPEGVKVSDLTQAQQDKVTAMLRVWVGDLDEEAAEAKIAQYVAEYDETYLGWSGGTTLDNEQTYIRIDGPSAWIEFSNQPGIETTGVHHHTIFRDQAADYGVSSS